MQRVSVDLETIGLVNNGIAPEILCVSWCDGEYSYCGKWDVEMFDRISLMAQDSVFVFHNASFDKAVLNYYGVDVPYYEDTMIMSYVWQPDAPSHSLEYLGKQFGFLKQEKPWKGSYPTEYTDELAEYCRNDAGITLEIYYKLAALLSSDQLALHYYLSVERPFIEVIQEMESTGIYVDDVEMQHMNNTLSTRCTEIRETLVKQVGLCPIGVKNYKKPHPDKVAPQWHYLGEVDGNYGYQEYGEFNPNSNHHKAHVLRAQAGWEPEEMTRTGEPKVSKEVLDKIQHPIADMLVEYGTMNKILTSFIQPFEKFMDEGHVLRGNFNQAVTITGRLSSSQPNMQNLPARGELGKQLRNIITTPSEDVCLFNGDLSNIEARMLAWMLHEFLGESSLAEIFISGRDFHTSNAEAWGVSRTAAKTLLFAILYGASAPRIAKTLKSSVSEAEHLIDKLNKALPAVQAMKEMVWQTASESGGVIHTLLGHRLVYPDILSKHRGKKGKAERQLFNAFIQGSSGDVLKYLTNKSMPVIIEHEANLAASVHDELLGYVSRANAQSLCEQLTHTFSNCTLILPVPIEAEFKHGYRWGDLKG